MKTETRKALIDLDWLNSYREEREMVNKAIGVDLRNPVEIIDIIRSKCEPVGESKEKEMLSLLQRMYDEYSMNERITGSLLKFMIEARELIKKAKQLN